MKFEELNLPTIWTQIKGYTNYQISICGQVKNITTNKILKNSKSNTGYFVVTLSKDNQDKKYLIHRLVALNFIENPNYFGKLQGKAREMITSRYGQLHVWKAIHEEYLHFSNK